MKIDCDNCLSLDLRTENKVLYPYPTHDYSYICQYGCNHKEVQRIINHEYFNEYNKTLPPPARKRSLFIYHIMPKHWGILLNLKLANINISSKVITEEIIKILEHNLLMKWWKGKLSRGIESWTSLNPLRCMQKFLFVIALALVLHPNFFPECIKLLY